MMVDMVIKMRIIVVFRIRELEGILAGVLKGIQGSVVGGTRACMMGGGWFWLVLAGGKGFDRLVGRVLE